MHFEFHYKYPAYIIEPCFSDRILDLSVVVDYYVEHQYEFQSSFKNIIIWSTYAEYSMPNNTFDRRKTFELKDFVSCTNLDDIEGFLKHVLMQAYDYANPTIWNSAVLALQFQNSLVGRAYQWCKDKGYPVGINSIEYYQNALRHNHVKKILQYGYDGQIELL